MLVGGIPEYRFSDNRSEFVAKELRKWLAELGTGTVCV
jgi:transposase InsO family protein